MQLRVRDWMVDLVVYVEPDASVARALELMRLRYIHSLIVSKTQDSPEYGILTSTDISDKIIAVERDPSKVKVREIMTSPVITIPCHWSLKDCALKMSEHKIHHLPVIDEDGELTGMISDTDFLAAAEAMVHMLVEK
jgi:signal-transduction protein with cAMP-binding, CBS, and nucleotidyltransferase domain